MTMRCLNPARPRPCQQSDLAPLLLSGAKAIEKASAEDDKHDLAEMISGESGQ